MLVVVESSSSSSNQNSSVHYVVELVLWQFKKSMYLISYTNEARSACSLSFKVLFHCFSIFFPGLLFYSTRQMLFGLWVVYNRQRHKVDVYSVDFKPIL